MSCALCLHLSDIGKEEICYVPFYAAFPRPQPCVWDYELILRRIPHPSFLCIPLYSSAFLSISPILIVLFEWTSKRSVPIPLAGTRPWNRRFLATRHPMLQSPTPAFRTITPMTTRSIRPRISTQTLQSTGGPLPTLLDPIYQSWVPPTLAPRLTRSTNVSLALFSDSSISGTWEALV